MEMNKKNFLMMLDDCIKKEDVNFIAVGVEGIGDAVELIINPKVNFKTKRDYYEKSYNEKMELKANKDIKIGFLAGFYSFDQLRTALDNDEIVS